MCATQTRLTRQLGDETAGLDPMPCHFPRVVRGRPFSANPDEKVLRLALHTRAGSASPARLLVYPLRNGMSETQVNGGGGIGGEIFLGVRTNLDGLRHPRLEVQVC